MRDFKIDFTNKENPLLDGSVAGNQGEHNATKLIITPPEEMTNCADISFYKIAFELTNNRVIHSDPINKADTFEMLLPQQVTSSWTIGIQLEGYGADSELIAKSSKLSKILFRKSVFGTEIDYKGEPFGISEEVSANTLARHTHSNADVLNEFGENEAGKPTYKGELIGTVTGEASGRPTTSVITQYAYPTSTSIGDIDIIVIPQNSDVPKDVEIADIEFLYTDEDGKENWVSIRHFTLYDEFPYVFSMSKAHTIGSESGEIFLASIWYPADLKGTVWQSFIDYEISKTRITYYTD